MKLFVDNCFPIDYSRLSDGCLLISEKYSRMGALIRGWMLINFLVKFQGGRLFQDQMVNCQRNLL